MRRTLALLAVAALLGACTADDATPPADATTTTAGAGAPPAPAAPPDPPPVVVEGPIEGRPETSGADGLSEVGYVEEEFFVRGTARSYAPAGELADDGRWTLATATEAPYATRILVKRPVEPAVASGVAVIEWSNVSIGQDATPDWTFTRDEIVRSGHVHVAVSAQAAGVDSPRGGITGGPGNPLTVADPERYGTLEHPGDAWSYDIYGQVGALTRARPEGGPDPLAGIEISSVIAIGESQSAFRLTSYVNGVHPLAPVYDGFLIHSRGGGAAPFDDEPGLGSAVDGSVAVRDDLDVPVLIFTTETDLTVLGYAGARQPDSEWVRGWEVAGTAHADAHLVGGDAVAAGDGLGCEGPVNDGPQHLALKAALAHLVTWAGGGDPPPSGDPIEVDDQGQIVRDEDGNAVGGIRLPSLQVPTAALSGDPAGGSPLCRLFGSTRPFPAAELRARYGGVEDYLTLLDEAIDRSVADGFLLEADRATARAEGAAVDFG